MSAKNEVVEPPKEETSVVEQPVAQEMAREESVKKCCSIMKEDVHVAGKCCAYTWCCTLNGIEGLCVILSKCCLLSSALAMGCNKCLEEIDCDKH